MGRPIKITDEEVIRAGNALLAENRAVNGTRLWREVGEHGRPERLLGGLDRTRGGVDDGIA